MRLVTLLLLAVPLAHAESRLSGTVVSANGEKMAGVTVSAKTGTITTSVFTDKAGGFRFSPLPEGSYRVWAQALGYQTARTALDLSGDRKANLKLVRNSDAEQTFRQLPGNVVLDSLPEASDDDKRLKQLVRNGCTSCHTASYPLQHRFDEAGWNAIIELMKNVNGGGSYMAKERGKPTGILDHHQKELAAYLARVRGPSGAPKIAMEPRPAGEAARVEIREFDLPLDADAGLPANFVQN